MYLVLIILSMSDFVYQNFLLFSYVILVTCLLSLVDASVLWLQLLPITNLFSLAVMLSFQAGMSYRPALVACVYNVSFLEDLSPEV